jgi:hypothetical protein
MHNALHVRWFKTWQPALDDALAALPPDGEYPRELFRLLCETRGLLPKRFALVTERDRPVAVVGLRKLGRGSWTPVTTHIVPGAPFPVAEGRWLEVAGALGREVREPSYC